jgi:preprotein translocase subunit YajC
MNLLLVMVAVMVLMILMSTWGSRKEKKKRAEMLAAIGRHDRVQTIGGVIGTVVEMRDDEIVLRVDDATNTKITFSRSAVQGVLKKKVEAGAEAAQAAGV